MSRKCAKNRSKFLKTSIILIFSHSQLKIFIHKKTKRKHTFHTYFCAPLLKNKIFLCLSHTHSFIHKQNIILADGSQFISTPYVIQDRINNNNISNAESPKSPMETLDNLLESIAYENFTTNNYLNELMNGETITNGTIRLISNNNLNNNNNIINQKTDTLNRYLDNVINYNCELSSYHTNNNVRKSDSEGSSSDHNNGKVPHQVIVNTCLSSPLSFIF